MIKQLCSYMFGGHKECEEKLHNSSLTLLNQIQELKSINNYQTMELEQNIKELQAELIHEKWTTCKGDHSLIYKDLGQSLHIRDLEQKIADLEREMESNQQLYDEEYKKNIRLHERLDSVQTDNDSLKQQLECSQREVSTLSGVLNSEPIMEALGKKDE